jgi:hypothetical protein
MSKPSSIQAEIYSRLLLQIEITNFSDQELLLSKKILNQVVKVFENSFIKAGIEAVTLEIRKKIFVILTVTKLKRF